MIEDRITRVGFKSKSYASDRDRTQRKFLEARTLYKCKKDKIRPANQQHTGGIKPEGSENWKKLLIGLPCPENKKYPWLIPKFSDIERGSRLTPERIEKLKIGKGIMKEEREFLMEVLFSKEKGIAFDFTEKGVFKQEVEPPHVIPTIAHEPWQVANFKVPKALEGEVIEIIRKKLECGALERCCGPYRNSWFLVPKKDKGYRLINTAQRLNAVTIKDASLPPSAEEYSEDFAGFSVLSLLDLFSGYDQMALADICRDLTAFQTPLVLLRMTTLPQGYTNGVQVFDRVMKKILKDQISAKRGKPFIDDVGVKPPTRSLFLDSSGKPIEIAPGIRRYILEAIVSIDKVMADIERAGGTISEAKSEFLREQLKIVVYVCGMDGRSPEETKTRKITNWSPCIDLSDISAFLRLCVYYRIWIKDFSTIAEPLFRLSRKDVEFYWLEEQQIAMDELKKALTSAPALNPIDYESEGKIVLSVDSSLVGWEAIL